MLLIIFLISAVLIGVVLAQKFKVRGRPTRKIAVLGRPSRGKLLRDLAAQARINYPGQSEAWYWEKAQRDLKRYRG